MKLFRGIFLAFIFCISGFSFSQAQDFKHIDQFVQNNIPKGVQQNLEGLVNHLSKPAKNDLEKARSFFTWIAVNISYDTHYFYNKDTAEPCFSTDCILERNETVCLGYARLFKQMCEAANIPCEIIEGYSRENSSAINKKLNKSDHAWNALLINGNWYLVEPTWGSGYLDDQGVFHAAFDDSQFLVDPKNFVKTHLPLDPIWQLLESPVPVAIFKQGGSAIDQYLNRTPARLDYQKAIFHLLSLPADEALLKSAERAAKFNPENQFDLAYAYMDYAYEISKSESTKNVSIDQQIKRYRKALVNYRKSIELFRSTRIPEGKPHLEVCLNNVDHLKFMLNELEATVQAKNP